MDGFMTERASFVAMLLRIGGRERGLAHPLNPCSAVMAKRISVASIAATASPRPMKCSGTRIGMLETANTFPGKATASGAARVFMKSRKRTLAASSGMPKSSQRRNRQGLTTTRRTKAGRLATACHSAALRSSVEYGAFR